MKKFALMIAGIGIAAATVPAATAQAGWQNINQRQAQLDQRIDQGVRTGQLTRNEAARLRAEFRGIADLEIRYRRSAPGLTVAERRDLDRRFDALSRKIRAERHDGQGAGNWWNINQRQAQLDRRIDQGVRSGQLTRAEAVRLRAEFRGIVALEARYRQSRPGLTVAERADLDRRFDVLARKIRWERRDWENRR
jgi:polyhydroxyalkanoate synthesis regulator phasin